MIRYVIPADRGNSRSGVNGRITCILHRKSKEALVMNVFDFLDQDNFRNSRVYVASSRKDSEGNG